MDKCTVCNGEIATTLENHLASSRLCTESSGYRDLLQSHHSLCGKIDEMKEELRLSNLQVSELRVLCAEASESIDYERYPALYQLLRKASPTDKPNQEGLKLGESRNLPYPQPIHDKDAVKRNHEHELERMSSLYSYLSLARHRYLKAPDDLLKDIDKALVEGEKILKPWWDEQMAAKNAEASKKAK